MSNGIRDVVVLIPGIGGSVLERGGKEVWAPTPGAALRAALSLGRSVTGLELSGDDPEEDDLGDGVRATRLLPDLHIIPGLDWKIDGYGRVAKDLVSRFGCVPGENFFQLPYDWRRDNRVAARTLARNAHRWLKDWRERSGHDSAKLILVCHSMGGIVARIYLELLDGWRDTRRLITFGTPFSGSVNALEFLVNGFRRGWGPFTVDLSRLIGSFTSAYQLLPSYRCLAGPDGTWLPLDEVDWAETSLDGERLDAALALHREVRAAVDARLATGVPGYETRPVVGDFQRTGWAARRVGARVETLSVRELGEDGGDGTVPKVSAAPHESISSWANVTFVSQRHASLQNDDPVLDHVGGLLRATPLSPVDVFPAVDESISLEVDDVSTEEPMVVRATAVDPGAELVATIVPVTAGVLPARRERLHDFDDGWRIARVDGLPAGDYRVTVSGVGKHPVTDIASVVDLVGLEQFDDVGR